jgi:hypothetical protein
MVTGSLDGISLVSARVPMSISFSTVLLLLAVGVRARAARTVGRVRSASVFVSVIVVCAAAEEAGQPVSGALFVVMGSRAAIVVISNLMRSYTVRRIMRRLTALVHRMPILPASRCDDVRPGTGSGSVEGGRVMALLRHVDCVD